MKINEIDLERLGFEKFQYDTYPYGFYWINKKYKNHVVLAYNTYDGTYTYKDYRNRMYGLVTMDDLNTVIKLAKVEE